MLIPVSGCFRLGVKKKNYPVKYSLWGMPVFLVRSWENHHYSFGSFGGTSKLTFTISSAPVGPAKALCRHPNETSI